MTQSNETKKETKKEKLPNQPTQDGDNAIPVNFFTIKSDTELCFLNLGLAGVGDPDSLRYHTTAVMSLQALKRLYISLGRFVTGYEHKYGQIQSIQEVENADASETSQS